MLSDDELDEYVSSLLTSQAKRQTEAYSTLGFRAFLKNAEKERQVGKPNTRFLKNIVKNVDGYNAALAQKEERESRERLRELKRRDGEKMYGYKEDKKRRTRNGDEDGRVRRRRERSRSPTPRRKEDSRGKERHKSSRRNHSSDEERRGSRQGRSSDRRAAPEKSDSTGHRQKRRRRNSDSEEDQRRNRELTD